MTTTVRRRLPSMNTPPEDFIRIRPDRLRDFATGAFCEVGMPEEDAQLLAGLLVVSDLRGVFSHGTWACQYYVSQFRDGKLNVRPRVSIVGQTDTTATLDGDGGLGYFPAMRAAHVAAGKAKKQGVAVAVTRNHGHIGSAGHYSRAISAEDCIGLCASAAWSGGSSEARVTLAGGGSPISVAVPTGDEPPLVPDMGLYLYLPENEFVELFERLPDAFIKFLGLSSACQALAGVLAGIHSERPTDGPYFEGATQGAFLFAIDISRFVPIDEFKRQMDAYVAMAQRMKPFPGYERAELPGGPEARREREYAAAGIPVGPKHRASLDAVAQELGIATVTDRPWVGMA